MEQQIKYSVRMLNIAYILFWLFPALLFAAGEFRLFSVGEFADDGRFVYFFETAAILLTAFCIPFSLKLFSLVLKKKIDSFSIERALRCYVRWSVIRLVIIEIPVIVSIVCYYLTLSTTGNLCLLIGLTASLFCLPNEKRLRNELHITKS